MNEIYKFGNYPTQNIENCYALELNQVYHAYEAQLDSDLPPALHIIVLFFLFGADNDTSAPSIRLKTVPHIYYPHRAIAAGSTHAISHFRFFYSPPYWGRQHNQKNLY